MQTRCPHCETVFRLTKAQLSAAHGKVRCGLCHSIFTATAFDEDQDSPVELSRQESLPTELLQSEPSQQDETLNDNGYISEPLAETISEEDTSDSDDLLLNDIETSSVIPDEFRQFTEPTPNTHLATTVWSFGIVFLLITLVAEYAWFNRNQLAKDPEYQPWISQFCKTTGCTLQPLRKPDLIEMVNRNVYTHPNIKKALMITATMVNKAPHAQAYPDIEIGFSNIRGQMVTQRRFTPEEYMKMGEDQLRLLQPDLPVTWGIEIKDPGKQAMTYEFNFI